jgi:hypothetical protein
LQIFKHLQTAQVEGRTTALAQGQAEEVGIITQNWTNRVVERECRDLPANLAQVGAKVPFQVCFECPILLKDGFGGFSETMEMARLMREARARDGKRLAKPFFRITHDPAEPKAECQNRGHHLSSQILGGTIAHDPGPERHIMGQLADDIQGIVSCLRLESIHADIQTVTFPVPSKAREALWLGGIHEREKIQNHIQNMATRDGQMTISQVSVNLVQGLVFPEPPPPDLDNHIKTEATPFGCQSVDHFGTINGRMARTGRGRAMVRLAKYMDSTFQRNEDFVPKGIQTRERPMTPWAVRDFGSEVTFRHTPIVFGFPHGSTPDKVRTVIVLHLEHLPAGIQFLRSL